ncbi:hypothetical protein ACFFRN_07150 [Nonomuraea roseola]|uniref:Uncharacterized protein n=1 Tax=Nonomuraea roseola TaxID=46179 RepID=A0ABV5PT62_9ACTN
MIENSQQHLPFVDLRGARAQVTGSPAGVQTRCSRRPQNQREWERQ